MHLINKNKTLWHLLFNKENKTRYKNKKGIIKYIESCVMTISLIGNVV